MEKTISTELLKLIYQKAMEFGEANFKQHKYGLRFY